MIVRTCVWEAVDRTWLPEWAAIDTTISSDKTKSQRPVRKLETFLIPSSSLTGQTEDCSTVD